MLLFVVALYTAPADAGDAPVAPPPPPEQEEDVADLDAEVGELAADKISDVLQKNQWAVSDCVTRNAGSKVDGRVAFSWEITLEGKVQKLKVKESSIRNPPLEACLQKSIQVLTFPKPVGGVVPASHTFSF